MKQGKIKWTFFVLMLSVVLIAAGGCASGMRVYVAPNGNDSWSGMIPRPNAQGVDGPLASMEGAQKVIRKMRAADDYVPVPVTVVFADGVYQTKKTILFDSKDSGTLESPITYKAASGADPVISGGRIITGWTKDPSGKYWTAKIPDVKNGKWYFRQLFIDGKRAVRARYPNVEDYWFTIEQQLEPYPDGIAIYRDKKHIQNWPELKQIEMVLMRVWDFSIFKIATVDEKTRTVRLNTGIKERSMRRWRGDRRYYLENSLRFLDLPGEWYLDRKKGVCYLKPFDEKTFAKAKVVAPAVDLLIGLKGTSDKPVEHVRFEGLTFAYSQWTLPKTGYNSHQADVAAGASLVGDFVRSVTFSGCKFKHLGRYGLWLRSGCRDNIVAGCEFTDLGGGAIELGANARSTSPTEVTTRNELSRNHIHHNGQVWKGACGIWVGPASHTHIHNNHIHDHTYSGISFGWTWSDSLSGAHHNTVENNYIHDVMQIMGDGGGIYCLGRQDGSIIRNNVIHDVQGWNAQGNGIYTDQGSSGLIIENNLIVRTGWGGIGCGTNDNVVRNNIVVHSGKVGLGTYTGNRRRWQRNIIVVKQGLLVDARLKGEDNLFEDNLYYYKGVEDPVFPGGYLFSEWKEEMGQDANSIIAPPLFKDCAGGDFRLSWNSPAFKLGFKPFKIRNVGPAGPDMRDNERLRKLFKLRPPAGDLPARKDRPKIVARPRKAPVKIDGRKGSKEWLGIERIKMSQTPVRTIHPTMKSNLFVSYDNDYLYVFLEVPCDVNLLRAKDGIWARNDGAEICLQNVSGKKRGGVMIIRGYASGDKEGVSLSGEIRKLRLIAEETEFASHIGKSSWSGEWKIPLAKCGIDPKKDKKIWFNAGVRNAFAHKWIIWAGTGGSTHELYNAGDLVFGEK